jgi:hypothetical protein
MSKLVKACPPNSNEISISDADTLKHGCLKRWTICPEWCVCIKHCQCDQLKKLTKDQIKALQAHLKELVKTAQE